MKSDFFKAVMFTSFVLIEVEDLEGKNFSKLFEERVEV